MLDGEEALGSSEEESRLPLAVAIVNETAELMTRDQIGGQIGEG